MFAFPPGSIDKISNNNLIFGFYHEEIYSSKVTINRDQCLKSAINHIIDRRSNITIVLNKNTATFVKKYIYLTRLVTRKNTYRNISRKRTQQTQISFY